MEYFHPSILEYTEILSPVTNNNIEVDIKKTPNNLDDHVNDFSLGLNFNIEPFWNNFSDFLEPTIWNDY